MPSASTAAARGVSLSIHSLVRIGWPVAASTPMPAQCPSPLTSSFGTEPSSTSTNGSSRPAAASSQVRMNSSPDSNASTGLQRTIGGMPGSEPRSRSSSDGLVAAVIAIESPSQPSPLVSQRTCSGRASGEGVMRRSRSGRRPGRYGVRAASSARSATPGARRAGRAGASRRASPVTRPARDSRDSACEIDGRSAATIWPSSRCVNGRQTRMPDASTRPQRAARCQSRSTSRTSSRGWQEIARIASRSSARFSARRSRAWAICGQGSTRCANSSSSNANRVGWSARQPTSRSIMSSTRTPTGCSRSPVPSSSVTVRLTIRVCTATSPSSSSSPGPSPAAANHGPRSQSPACASSTRAVATCRAATRVRTSSSSARSSSASRTYAKSGGDSGRLAREEPDHRAASPGRRSRPSTGIAQASRREKRV